MDNRGIHATRVHQRNGFLRREVRDLPVRLVAGQAGAPQMDLCIDDMHGGASVRDAVPGAACSSFTSCVITRGRNLLANPTTKSVLANTASQCFRAISVVIELP